MGDILIQNILSQGITAVSNQFIDQYMPQANGEFVKVYLYLIRVTQGEQSMSLASIADVFNCTERDVVRALRYWEKEGLMKLTYESRKLTGIAFCASPATDAPIEASPLKEAVVTDVVTAETISEPKRKSLSAGQKRELQEKEEVRQVLYIAEQYLGRTLSKTDIDNLLYFYSELHFSADLIEYLVEYCVSKGSRSARYIETVALAWASEGISSVQEAKKATTLYNKNYFTILKAMGIKDRNPVEMEQKMMDNWLQGMGFSLDLIAEACQRTVMQTGQASFPYTDSILKGWHKKDVRHLSDLAALDKEHKKRTKRSPGETDKSHKTVDYPHRNYDYEEIKKALLTGN